MTDPAPSSEADTEDSPIERWARVGEPIEVRIPARPSSGYRWECGPLPEGIRRLFDRYAPDLPARPGRGGVPTFLLAADRAGQFTVHLRYRRPWEEAGMDTRELRLTVEPAGSPPGTTGSESG